MSAPRWQDLLTAFVIEEESSVISEIAQGKIWADKTFTHVHALKIDIATSFHDCIIVVGAMFQQAGSALGPRFRQLVSL